MKLTIIAGAISMITVSAAQASSEAGALSEAASTNAQFRWLVQTMDKFHKTFDVYTDVGAAGNHFQVIAKVASPNGGSAVTMDSCWSAAPQASTESVSCIRCSFESHRTNWGGFYFMNGVLRGTEPSPRENWGDEPDAGYALTNYDRISFAAKGAVGGEKVTFFVGGLGWSNNYTGRSIKPRKSYSDSFKRVATSYIKLGENWKTVVLRLPSSKKLTYVISGFGWATNARKNRNRDITFYVDNIQWTSKRQRQSTLPNDLRLLVSYQTCPTNADFDLIARNAAYTYDNALALLAFIARGTTDDLQRAKILADSLAYATEHDRFYTNCWLRNAYMGGNLVSFPGWEPNEHRGTARMPGFWHEQSGTWYEVSNQVSIYTGNAAWTMIALIAAYERLGHAQYLNASVQLGEWIESNFRDVRGAGGYTGGYEGWEPNAQELLYKSTEHNMDVYVAFQRLYQVTGDDKWHQRALHARGLVEAMWDDIEGKFWTGTDDSGVTINRSVIPLDVQAWSILTFPDSTNQYSRAIAYAEEHHSIDAGFDFSTNRYGVWYEGTAQMACAYQAAGQDAKARTLLNTMDAAQLQSGAIPAASKDGLDTGLGWVYYRRGHVGATAWYLSAKLKINPFWLK